MQSFIKTYLISLKMRLIIIKIIHVIIIVFT